MSSDPKSTLSRSIQAGMFGHEFDDKELFADSKEKAPKKIRSLISKVKMTLFLLGYWIPPGNVLRKTKNKTMKEFNKIQIQKFYTSKDIFHLISENSHQMTPVFETHMQCSISSMMYNMALLNLLSSAKGI